MTTSAVWNDNVSLTANSDPAIAIRDLVYRPHNSEFELAVREWDVAAGERVALTGPSGSGKTTLLKLISGELQPNLGEITVLGTALPGLACTEREKFRRRNLGIVFQEFCLIDYLTVAQNIAVADYLGGRGDSPQQRQRVEELAGGCGLTALLPRFPNQLSQGEKQRVALVRAIYGKPAVILADEPTGNLDCDTACRVLELLFDLVAAESSTLVLVTHDERILDRFDRVVALPDLLGN